MAHYKRKSPRNNCAMSGYNHLVRRRGGENNLHRLDASCPSGWNTIHHIRPHRRATRNLLTAVLRGADVDAIAWPVAAKKPHIYRF